MNILKEYETTNTLSPDTIKFYETSGHLLGGKTAEYDGRVNLLRMFPLTTPSQYISVRNQDMKEIGMIEDISIFEDKQLLLIETELSRRYFVPDIISVYDVKEEFGNYFWDCDTTAGRRTFTVRDLSNNLLRLSGGTLTLIDTDGNRYAIQNVHALGTKALRVLDIWL